MEKVLNNQINSNHTVSIETGSFVESPVKKALLDRVDGLKTQLVGSAFDDFEQEEKAREATVKALESKLGITSPLSMKNDHKISWLMGELSKRDVKEQIEILKSIDDKLFEKNSGASVEKLQKEAEKLKKHILSELKNKKNTGDIKLNEDLKLMQEELSFIDLKEGDNAGDFIFDQHDEFDSQESKKKSKNTLQ